MVVLEQNNKNVHLSAPKFQPLFSFSVAHLMGSSVTLSHTRVFAVRGGGVQTTDCCKGTLSRHFRPSKHNLLSFFLGRPADLQRRRLTD